MKKINYNLMQGDCIEKLKELPKESIDLIIVDPPYNIGINYGTNKDSLSNEEYLKWCVKWMKESARVLKENGSIYVINYPENNAYLFDSLHKSLGRTNLLFRSWITWHYPSNTGHSPKNFTKSQRSILFYSKGNKFKFNLKEGEVIEDYLEFNLVKNTSKEKVKGFPNQIPLKLLKLLIGISSNKGDTVLDFFMGSGSTGIASLDLNRNFMGIELDKNNFDLAYNRIKNSEKEKIRCKDCGEEFTERERNKDLWTKKFLDTDLCLGCFRIKESEDNPESTRFLDIEKFKEEREERRKENEK